MEVQIEIADQGGKPVGVFLFGDAAFVIGKPQLVVSRFGAQAGREDSGWMRLLLGNSLAVDQQLDLFRLRQEGAHFPFLFSITAEGMRAEHGERITVVATRYRFEILLSHGTYYVRGDEIVRPRRQPPGVCARVAQSRAP